MIIIQTVPDIFQLICSFLWKNRSYIYDYKMHYTTLHMYGFYICMQTFHVILLRPYRGMYSQARYASVHTVLASDAASAVPSVIQIPTLLPEIHSPEDITISAVLRSFP